MDSQKHADTFVQKVANIEDGVTGDAYEEFRFMKERGIIGSTAIDRDKSHDKRAVLSVLRRKNARLPPTDSDAEKLVHSA